MAEHCAAHRVFTRPITERRECEAIRHLECVGAKLGEDASHSRHIHDHAVATRAGQHPTGDGDAQTRFGPFAFVVATRNDVQNFVTSRQVAVAESMHRGAQTTAAWPIEVGDMGDAHGAVTPRPRLQSRGVARLWARFCRMRDPGARAVVH